jgi:phosphotriesterase-related protein
VAESAGYVQTVRGRIEPSAVGRTLMHEHLVNINAEVARDQPGLSWADDRATAVGRVVEAMRGIASRGVSTILDATAIGHGRDIETVREVNAAVDLNIVVCTGLYSYDELPHFFAHRKPSGPGDRDVLTEMFVRDLTVGIAGTDVKAGAIKCVTDLPGVTPNVDRTLRAAAAAQRETGVLITTHSRPLERNGLDQQRVFAEEGVDLTRVVIGHSGDTTDLDYLRELMDAGSTIGCDRFGMYFPTWLSMHERIDTIARLCELGYADRIVVSHDYTPHSDWFATGEMPSRPEHWRQTHIVDDVLPAMSEAGISDEHLDQILVHNPRRLLEVTGAY